MKNTIKVFIMLLLIFTMITYDSKVFATENKIEIVTYKPKDNSDGKFLNLIYTEAFKRLGKSFIYKIYPAKRCSYLADSGEVDGELTRIYSYNEVHPNLIRIEEPHWTSGFIAVAADTSIHLDGWKSLKNTNYRVDYKRGIKGCDVNLPKVVKPEKLQIVNSVFQGYNKILKGRTDIFVGAELNMVSILNTKEFRNSKLRIAGVMEKFTAHLFLHKKHKEIVPKLSNVLKEMKQEGLFKKYRDTAQLLTYFTD